MPELTSIFSSISDFHRIDDNAGIPQFDEYSDNLLEGSPYFKQYLQQVSKRADDIRNGKVKREEDNMLKLTTDGRKAAIDMRLINENYGPYFDSKVRRCAENIFKEYNNALDTKGNQLVFCDVSTPKDSFNLYHELKRLLIEMGMNEKKVAFVHDADTEKQRQALFQQMITGEIAVLIGSTSKMGHGMNVQEHLVALHHLDVPWRPSDMVQREGRILRQGNKNKAVSIYRYITKNSFDAYSWQLLEIKQRFISQIMSGGATMREGMDVDDSILNYAEVKALAVGNPLIKRRIEVSNEIDRLLILQRTWNDEIRTKEKLRRELPEKIERQEELIRNCMLDIAEYDKGKIDYSEMKYDEQKEIRKNIYESVWKYQDCPVDKHIMDYQGFKVVVPAYMHPRLSKEKEGSSVGRRVPYIHLIKNNTYSLEIEAESGITVRLNNFLENLSREREKHEGLKRTYENRLAAIETELNKESCDYSDEIEKLRYELSMLNKELGVA